MDKKLYHELGFAKVDTNRELRMGTDEVIFCRGKTVSQIVAIAQVILESSNKLLATKTNLKIFKAIKSKWSNVSFMKGLMMSRKLPKPLIPYM